MSTEIVQLPQEFPPRIPILPDPASELTVKQKLWADAFIETRNATKSAELAGYAGDNSVLRVQGSANLANPNIRAYLENRFAELVIGSNEVLSELSQMARHNVLDDPQGPIQAKDKLKALELAGKFYKHWDRTDESSLNPEAITAFATVIAAACEAWRADRERQAQVEASPVIDVTPVGTTP